MLKAGLTYAELVDLGLTPASMVVFTHITLYGWAQLGMTRADVARFPEPVVVSLFGLPKQEVLRSLK
jgi:hypothetical protein